VQSSTVSTPRRPPVAVASAVREHTVFGLDVRSCLSLPALERSRARKTGRTLELSAISEGRSWNDWPPRARTICLQRHPGGAVCFRIEADASAGHRIWGEGRGSYLLSQDSCGLRCAVDGVACDGWERFFVGQVLPYAALLSGLEIFHASAVDLDGRAVAFVGPSGAGKTSLALALCRLGAGFVADDVLALEPCGRALMAHPGTPLAGVEREEALRLERAGARLPSEALSADARERLVHMPGAEAPKPLSALFFLDRRHDDGGALRFESATDPRLLLGSTFNFVLDTPGRLRGLLDVCALAAGCRVERIVIPASVDASALAGALLARLRGNA